MTREWQEAVQRADEQALGALLAGGAKVDALDRHGQTALMLAARNGHVGVVQLLVAHGATLDVTAKYGLSALMLAVLNHRVEIACMLVDAGANLELKGTGAPGFFGKTAADMADHNGDTDVADYIRRAAAAP